MTMAVEIVKMEGTHSAKVYHNILNDPMLAGYVTLIEVEGDQVRVGTPLACASGLSLLEIYSVVQLILGRAVVIKAEPVDTVVSVAEEGCPRDWKTYDLTWP